MREMLVSVGRGLQEAGEVSQKWFRVRDAMVLRFRWATTMWLSWPSAWWSTGWRTIHRQDAMKSAFLLLSLLAMVLVGCDQSELAQQKKLDESMTATAEYLANA